MLLTVHATAGALIGQQINNPLLAFILSFVSHFVLDLVPHGDQDWIDEYKGDQKSKVVKIIMIVAVDIVILLGLLVSRFYFIDSFATGLSIASGIIGGLLPDFLVGCHELSNRLFKKFYRFHFWIHDLIKVKPTAFQGVAFQVIITGILLLSFR
ncbi:hypothetical protein KKD80_00640 [Patescibacteria group bacterium]|nr:hypothetical protein [Patescibacteria group bacterium]